MSPERQARIGVRLGAGLVTACLVVLLADYAVATRRAPVDEKLIKALQQQVKQEAALAPRLAAEQKRVTGARRARKRRDKVAAWVLMAASGLFLASSKRVLRVRERPAPAAPAKAVRTVAPQARARAGEAAAAAPAIDLAFVDQVVAREGRGQEAAIVILQAIQAHYRYLPDEALRHVCERTEITAAQIAGTSSFYGQFRRSPVGRHIVRVCHGTACHVAGARQVTDELRRYLALPEGVDTDAARMFTVEEVACLGCCSLAPVMMVDGHTAGRLTPPAACAALEPFDRQETA